MSVGEEVGTCLISCTPYISGNCKVKDAVCKTKQQVGIGDAGQVGIGDAGQVGIVGSFPPRAGLVSPSELFGDPGIYLQAEVGGARLYPPLTPSAEKTTKQYRKDPHVCLPTDTALQKQPCRATQS